MYLSWTDETYYKQLAARYEAPHQFNYSSRLDVLTAEVEKHAVKVGRLREFYQSDLQACREKLNRENDPLAFAGDAALLQPNFEGVLKAVKKLRPTQKQLKAVNLHGKYYAPWFEGVLLRFDRNRLSASIMTTDDEGSWIWVTSAVTCGCVAYVPFRVFVPLDTLYSLVKLLDKERIDLRYRWLVGKLEICQGKRADGRYTTKVQIKSTDLRTVPGGEDLQYL